MRAFCQSTQKKQRLMTTPTSGPRSAVMKSFIKHTTPLRIDAKVGLFWFVLEDNGKAWKWNWYWFLSESVQSGNQWVHRCSHYNWNAKTVLWFLVLLILPKIKTVIYPKDLKNGLVASEGLEPQYDWWHFLNASGLVSGVASFSPFPSSYWLEPSFPTYESIQKYHCYFLINA